MVPSRTKISNQWTGFYMIGTSVMNEGIKTRLKAPVHHNYRLNYHSFMMITIIVITINKIIITIMVEFSFTKLKKNLSIIYFKNFPWIAVFDPEANSEPSRTNTTDLFRENSRRL